MRKLTCKNGNIVYVGTQEEVRTIHHAMYRAWLKDKIQITPTGYFTYERIRIEGFNLIQGILLDKREGYFDPMSFDEIMEMFINGKFRTYQTAMEINQKGSVSRMRKSGKVNKRQKNKRVTNEFVVTSANGNITGVGNSAIMQPNVKFSGKPMKWFDDSKLLKKK